MIRLEKQKVTVIYRNKLLYIYTVYVCVYIYIYIYIYELFMYYMQLFIAL